MLNDRRWLAVAGHALFFSLIGACLAHAQSPLGIGAAEPSFQPTGPFAGIFAWVNTQQQAFYRALTGALRHMREDPWALTSLVGLSFAYGVFHAAGPGHGKAVISSYMIANETELRRGVVISFVSALMQGFVAILLIGAAYLLLRGSSVSMTDATRALEIVSFAMIVMFGAWLLFRKVRSLVRAPAVASGRYMAMETTGAAVMQFDDPGRTFVLDRQAHHRHGPGEVCSTCGHAHAPDPQLLGAKDFSIHEAWSAIVAVGLRPCSGALLVLTFSLLNGLYLGGILSVIAMSIGTAITVSILATLAVTAKDMAVRFAGGESSTGMRIGHAIEILGALLVLVMGLLLLGAALQA
ncbi:nickel/cobalt transporter [Rhizobiaceae bacterium n13]|uniref:Nickel/cobalt efflux system n=1 Tax=Ferirhizobium litorale TaxID=2927786 RepID=A0AAE3QBJ5_9HYPH|nr:nickel/cobalt transporter [Fererhizobium litorale]MDI7860450.1 nickel/cobalt transporter [Fererhizobium litorale]MDI7920585.1 nickel/cobalt transporter [Fererhizobium litorale]